MPRPPDTPGKPRTERVTIRLTPEGAAALDHLRGQVTRSAYLRALLAAETRRTR